MENNQKYCRVCDKFRDWFSYTCNDGAIKILCIECRSEIAENKTTRLDEHERQIKILVQEWTKAKLEIQKIKDWVKEFTGRDLDKVFDVNIGKWVTTIK